MLRLISIRNFVVVEALDLEIGSGFTTLTGETGAGKSILLDALALLLGDRFEQRQLRVGADRAELAAVFDAGGRPEVGRWLADQGLEAADVDDGELLLRRTLDAQGKSRAWINGRPSTLSQLSKLGEMLVDLHGQHEHQSLLGADAQRALLDAFAGATSLARDVAAAWRTWREATERSAAAAKVAAASAAEEALLDERRRELAALAFTTDEWASLNQAQSRLAHATSLLEAAAEGEEALTESDASLVRALSGIIARLAAGATHDPALQDIVALLEPARIQLIEAGRELRAYRQRLDLDPSELTRIEERLAAIHDAARRFRTRAEALPDLLADTEARLASIAESSDAEALAARAAAAEREFQMLAGQLSAARLRSAQVLGERVTAAMQELAMAGGRFEIALVPLANPASYGCEQVEFRVASHPKQPVGPFARVASGGELSRIALAIQVVTSEVGAVPTLVFDEVDTGIGGAVAATVGRLMQSLGARRQVLCVTHLPQVAACADQSFRVSKQGDADSVRAQVDLLHLDGRIEELARMLAGGEITAKARAHAKELLEAARRM